MFGLSHLPELVLSFVPLIIFGALLFFLMRNARSNASDPAPRAPDKYDQLRRLADLRRDGVLSEVEFQQEKAKLLAQDDPAAESLQREAP